MNFVNVCVFGVVYERSGETFEILQTNWPVKCFIE